MSSVPNRRYTVEEYFALEAASDTKYEYDNGVIYAMSGASEAHNLVAVNVVTALNVALRERDCRVYPSDMRVLSPQGGYRYPDASVGVWPRVNWS